MSNNGKDYVFAASRIRSVEKNLLTREKAEKMLDSKTPSDALKILLELSYGKEETAENIAVSDFEKLLSEETKKTYDLIRSIAADEKDFFCFLYLYDYHNIKVLLKAEFLGIDGRAFLIDAGSVSIDKLAVMIKERNLVSLTAVMRQAVLDAVDVFARTNDPQAVDFLLDQACYTDMLLSAKESGNSFIQGYVSLAVDVVNLKAFVRLREMGKPWDVFSKVYISGGRIQEKLFISGYDESYEQFSPRLLAYGLDQALLFGGEELRESGRFTVLEKLCDDALITYAQKAKAVSFGPEPLAAYIIAKEAEIRTARIIMAGLLQGIDRAQIAERVRASYV